MYSVTYHPLELHGKVIVHARESIERHFTKIDFTFHVV